MQTLHENHLTTVLRGLTQPVLGICLGLQLLAERSEEDDAECLGVIPGTARKLEASPLSPVPNMGWCPVTPVREHALFEGIANGSHFYFVHSYALAVAEFTVATATHKGPLTAIASERNFCATQFHPERSAGAGARLLANFMAMQ